MRAKIPASIVEIGSLYRVTLQVDTAGYEIRRPRKDEYVFESDRDEPHLFGLGGKIAEREIAPGDEDVFVELLLMEPTEKSAIEFTSKFGLLCRPFSPGHGVPLHWLYATQELFARVRRKGWTIREVANYFEKSDWKVATADLELSTEKSKQPSLRWRVDTLRAFCWIEFIEDLKGSSKIAICTTCSKFFRRRSTYKGPLPSHCSSACKQRHYRERKK